MIMSYIQAGLIGQRQTRSSPLVAIEQVGQVTSGSHRQPVSDPIDRDGGFGPEPGRQPHLERMALAPVRDLLLRDPISLQRLGDQALGLGFARFPKLCPIMPFAPLLLDIGKLLATLPQRGQKQAPVVLVAKDHFPVVPAIHHARPAVASSEGGW